MAVIRAERISINWKFTGPVRLQKAMEVEELAKSNRETEILVQAMATRKFLHGMVLFCIKHSWAGGVPAGKLNVMAGYS